MKSVRQALCLLCLLFANVLIAQEEYLAIRTGYSNTKLISSSNSDVDINPRHSWHLSLAYSYIFENELIGFSFEPGFMVKGTRIEADTLDYKFNFLSVPFLFDFYPIKKLKISAGPEIGYLINAKNIVNDTTTIEINDVYDNRLELSGTISASYSISFFANLGVRYNKTFTPLASNDIALKREDLFSEYFQIFITLKIAN